MFARGQSVGVAVSGGADSVCLLHALVELRSLWALRLKVLHLDHRLRGEESGEDARFVRDMALRLGLPAHVREADVRSLRLQTADNLEQAARQARRRFFLECLESGLVDRVALGHTRSDQAETVLFRILRGCGTAGLAGILPVTREGMVRPLLEVDRREVEAFLRQRGIQWREDSSNRDPAYARNRIRHQLLPALTRDWNPSLPEALARMARLAQQEEQYWEEAISRLAETQLAWKPPAVLLRADALRSLAPPVARRLLRRAIQRAKGDLRRIEFCHTEAILRLAEEKEGHGRARIPGLDVVRSFEWIRLAPPAGEVAGDRDFRQAVVVPGEVVLPGEGLRLEFSVTAYGGEDEGLDWERLPGPLELRYWSSGDRYQPAGHATEARLKELFQQHKVPFWERRRWPVLTGGREILWARRFGPAAGYGAARGTRQVLKIHETKNPTAELDQEAHS
jgi:tRNA(Ile)-lysidine synthase